MRMVAENSHWRIPGRTGKPDGCAAPAGGFVPRTREAPGPEPGGITTALPGAWLDWDWRVASSQEARTRGQKSPRWSAAGRARRKTRPRCAKRGLKMGALRRSVTLAFAGGEGRRRRPPRAAKNRGDDACPRCLTIESVSANRSSPRKRGPIRSGPSIDCGVWVPGLASLARDDSGGYTTLTFPASPNAHSSAARSHIAKSAAAS